MLGLIKGDPLLGWRWRWVHIIKAIMVACTIWILTSCFNVTRHIVALPLIAGGQFPWVQVSTSDGHMWTCHYFDNKEGKGAPLATVTMEHLASDWQLEIGYTYDGPPALSHTNHSKSNFYLKCNAKAPLGRGSYKMMPYVNCDYFRLVVDKNEIFDSDKSFKNMRKLQSSYLDLDTLYYDFVCDHSFEVIIGVLKEQRSWAMFSWSRIHSYARNDLGDQSPEGDFSIQEKIACAATPVCNGPTTNCHKKEIEGIAPSEAPWGLCLDFVPKANGECLVYSFGIRDIYSAELLYGRQGCEVHAFDCTVNYREQLGPNVTFHPWCLGSDSSELKLDGKMERSMYSAQNGTFMDLPSIIKHLGHELSELTILKMDCEGCEWEGLDMLSQTMPEFYSRIRMFLVEMHFVTNLQPGTEERSEELVTISRVMDNLHDLRTFGFRINSDLSTERFNNPIYYDELYDSGLFVGACCYEFSMVRKDLLLAS